MPSSPEPPARGGEKGGPNNPPRKEREREREKELRTGRSAQALAQCLQPSSSRRCSARNGHWGNWVAPDAPEGVSLDKTLAQWPPCSVRKNGQWDGHLTPPAVVAYLREDGPAVEQSQGTARPILEILEASRRDARWCVGVTCWGRWARFLGLVFGGELGLVKGLRAL